MSLEKRYGKRRGFKFLRNRAHQEIYRKDILQPMQREFRDVYNGKYLNNQMVDRAIEAETTLKAKELEKVYNESTKHVLTIEQKTLKDLQVEHPTMVSEEDIIRWNQKTT